METRSIEREVHIAAPPDVVWRALTEADELMRWFSLDAKVEPGVGGSIWMSWGEGAEGKAPITVWEPLRRAGWAEEYGPVRLAIDFYLEPAQGGTVVRLVHSGFGTGAEWDDQFHMTEGGWTYFMYSLRHYIERHAGTPRVMISAREKINATRDDAYAALLGERGLAAAGTLRGLQPGDRYRITTSSGDVLEGSVIIVQEGIQFGCTIDNLNDALLFVEIEPAGEGEARPSMWLSTYGLSAERVASLRATFSALYRAALLTASLMA